MEMKISFHFRRRLLPISFNLKLQLRKQNRVNQFAKCFFYEYKHSMCLFQFQTYRGAIHQGPDVSMQKKDGGFLCFFRDSPSFFDIVLNSTCIAIYENWSPVPLLTGGQPTIVYFNPISFWTFLLVSSLMESKIYSYLLCLHAKYSYATFSQSLNGLRASLEQPILY